MVAETVVVAEAVTAEGAALICAGCGVELPEGTKFCNNCGEKVVIPPPPEEKKELICSGCGVTLPEGTKFCNNCGAKAVLSVPAAAAVPVASASALCKNCGMKNEGSKFCKSCGFPMDAEVNPVPAPAPQALYVEKKAKKAKKGGSRAPFIITIVVLTLALAAMVSLIFFEDAVREILPFALPW